MQKSIFLRQRSDGGHYIEFFYLGKRFFLKSGETTGQWLFSKDHLPNIWTPLRNAFQNNEMFARTAEHWSPNDNSDYGIEWEEALFHIKLQLCRFRYGVSVPTKI